MSAAKADDREESIYLAGLFMQLGTTSELLKRYSDTEQAFESAIRIISSDGSSNRQATKHALERFAAVIINRNDKSTYTRIRNRIRNGAVRREANNQ